MRCTCGHPPSLTACEYKVVLFSKDKSRLSILSLHSQTTCSIVKLLVLAYSSYMAKVHISPVLSLSPPPAYKQPWTVAWTAMQNNATPLVHFSRP